MSTESTRSLSSASEKPQPADAKDDSLFWDQYVKEADLYDKELVKGLGSDLDTLLIFAGLFSAINTAFIIESYQDLKPDPAESGGTNALLRTLIHAINNSTDITPSADFIPPPRAIVVNSFFFASLCCSLFSAFGAVLAKQWLNEYERTGDNRAPHARARQRHAKLLGMQRYRCEIIMQGLSTILQVSLFLFFVALANWLWGINHTIAIIVLIGVAITFTFYLSTTVISIIDFASPFSTRFSALLRELWSSKSTAHLRPSTHMDRMDGECIAWVRHNATMFESVAGMARAAAYLPDNIRRRVGLSHADVGTSLLRSIISSNAIPLGLTNGTLFSTITTIRYAMTSWKEIPIVLACDVIAQLHEMLRHAVSKDPVMSESITLILYGFDADVPLDLLNRTQYPTQATMIDLIQMPSLTIEGRRAALSLLWRYHLRWRYGGGDDVGAYSIEGLPEDSWQWRVADTLASTAVLDGQDDPDFERLAFRMAWATAYGPDKLESRQLLYREETSISPLWSPLFTGTDFKSYLERQIQRYPARRDLILRKTAMKWLASEASFTMPESAVYGLYPLDSENEENGWIRIAFHVGQEFRPEYMAPLYWWYHFHANHERYGLTIPAAYTSKRYSGSRSSNSWRSSSAGTRGYPKNTCLEPWPRSKLTLLRSRLWILPCRRIRNGSYRYQGRGLLGQELWNCFKLVVRLLHPGDGVVKFRAHGSRLIGSAEDDLENYHPRFLGSGSGREYEFDWEEVEAVNILGLDPYGLPPITGKNFLGFDSYADL